MNATKGSTAKRNTAKEIDLFRIFAEDKRLILYRPSWRKITGSVTATILLQQILFHWDQSDRRPFYKFKEPCQDNKLYTSGDSWLEEIGFGRREFDTAIKKIGCKISKRRLQHNPDLKQHLKPVEYWTDEKHTTWYTIHEKNLSKLLSTLYKSAEKQTDLPCENGECPLKDKSYVRESTERTLGKEQTVLQETDGSYVSESTDRTTDLKDESAVRKSTDRTFDLTENTTKIRSCSETTTTESPVAVQKQSIFSFQEKKKKGINGNRKFSPEIEERIQTVTKRYGEYFEYPDNFSELCRSDEFYERITQEPAILTLLQTNIHAASKKEHVGNVVGYAREVTRALLKGGNNT